MKQALEAPGVALHANALIALRPIALKATIQPVLAQFPGGFAGKRKGTGQEVADLREYAAGDDVRHLDRSATARTGRLHVRQFREERDHVTLLVADFRPAMFWGLSRAFLSVAAAEVLSLIGWSVVEDSGRVGLMAVTAQGPVLQVARGRSRGMLGVIGGMVRAHAAALGGGGETQRLDLSLASVERLCPRGSEIVIASGFDRLGDDWTDRLGQIDRHRTVRLIELSDADALPAGRYPVRLRDGRRMRLALSKTPSDETSDLLSQRPVLRLNAGDPLDRLARQIAAAMPTRP